MSSSSTGRLTLAALTMAGLAFSTAPSSADWMFRACKKHKPVALFNNEFGYFATQWAPWPVATACGAELLPPTTATGQEKLPDPNTKPATPEKDAKPPEKDAKPLEKMDKAPEKDGKAKEPMPEKKQP